MAKVIILAWLSHIVIARARTSSKSNQHLESKCLASKQFSNFKSFRKATWSSISFRWCHIPNVSSECFTRKWWLSYTEFPFLFGEFLQNLWEFQVRAIHGLSCSLPVSEGLDSTQSFATGLQFGTKGHSFEIWLSGHGFGMISIGQKHPWSLTGNPWRVAVAKGKLSSNHYFLGAMLNFDGVLGSPLGGRFRSEDIQSI